MMGPLFQLCRRKKNLILHLWLQSSAPKLHMEFTGGLLITNGETINRYFKLVWDLLHICMYNYVYIYPTSSNVCKITAFSGIIAGGFFSASEQILHFSHVAYVCRF